MSRSDVIQAIRDYYAYREYFGDEDLNEIENREVVIAISKADDLVRVVMRELDIKTFEVG